MKKTKTSVMIVDDEVDFLSEVEFLLKENGYDVATANCGEDALSKVLIVNPDIIFLDITMPDIDGFQVLWELKSNSKSANVPVIMLTAKGWTDYIFKAQQMNATDYMIKPFVEEELLTMINRYALQ